jgi:hypothetical protein
MGADQVAAIDAPLTCRYQLVVSYNVYRCWPITYEAFSTLDVDGRAMFQERLVLIYQSFERNLAVVAQPDPTKARCLQRISALKPSPSSIEHR